MAAVTLGAMAASTSTGWAAPTLRVQVDQQGDFVLLGNTIGHECAAGTPAPIVGTVGTCGNNTGDSSPDIYWRANPLLGDAAANSLIAPADARSTAMLVLPPGATVTHAFLYWAGSRGNGDPNDTQVTVERPGIIGGFSETVNATQSFNAPLGNQSLYQSVADITGLVQAQGAGAYRVSGIFTAPNFVNANNETLVGGWSMVVFYQNPADPPRNLALFDGLDVVSNGNNQLVTLQGFTVPNAGFDGKVGVITYEGDASITGDQFLWDGVVLSNGLNPANNFFNGTRSFFGAGVTHAGDLPQLSGDPQSMGGMDLDVVDITNELLPGQDSANVQATSTQDTYALGAFITSISTFVPNFSSAQKTAVDVNGGQLVPGDTVEFTIVVTNSGNDAAVDTTMVDNLPAGMTYVASSLTVDGTPRTDAVGDDVFDYDMANDRLTVRLGTGANAANGGTMAIGATTTVRFRVTIDAGAGGILQNQAEISAEGELGAPSQEWPTGSPNGPGTPTEVPVDACQTDSDCPAATPVCNTVANPNRCVECLDDGDCSGLEPSCDEATNTCTCVPSGVEACDSNDNDCDGVVDNVTGQCTVGQGICQATGNRICINGADACDATPGQPMQEMCGDALDSDCDGDPENGCIDSDGDGLLDNEEEAIGTDPNDADSDDDGVPDGDEPSYDTDSDGDGLINALDPDSDNDGLFDGTELGLDCASPATDATVGNCIADGDGGATTTDPLDADTDDGGVNDGSEDFDRDGVLDPGETDPTTGHGDDDDDNLDDDNDGLSNGTEVSIGTDPNDADSDDDGVIDGDEPNPTSDTDGDGLINALDPDSDGDGLFDGTELGLGCGNGATDVSAGNCIADADGGATTTSPLDPDTDDGGVSDGDEDTNKNGAIDPGERDPNDPSDDVIIDSDGDGLSDDFETSIGTDPNDADSDDDGVSDGDEPSLTSDTDGDGLINALDPDSDNDGLLDGTELGTDCMGPDTDPATCVPDGDGGATKTDPLDADTDDGGVSDGDEDTNKNGVVDPGERDPLDPADDKQVPPTGCDSDDDCGGANSGKVCDTATSTCIEGCRGSGGNGCPDGETCSSDDATIGQCAEDEDEAVFAQGNGFSCAASTQDSRRGGALALVAIAVVTVIARRKKRAA